jgi:hypothetical protein
LVLNFFNPILMGEAVLPDFYRSCGNHSSSLHKADHGSKEPDIAPNNRV